MKHLRVVQIGYGTVGGAVLEQIVENRARWRERLGLDITVVAFGGRKGAVAVDIDHGIPEEACLRGIQQRRDGDAPVGRLTLWDAVIHQATAHAHTVVLDAAAGSDTATYDAMALDLGAGVVLSNKAPLALPMSDPRSRLLWREARSNGRLRYETTVGAGLPVISTLQTLLDTGDTIVEMQGMLSGTFGAIFSDVAAGTPFSRAVRVAKEAGYTEPDPRDDLSGLDVARKALILARSAGHEVDLDSIDVRSFVPDDLAGGTVDEFLSGIERMNDEIGNLAGESVADGGTLKYVATVGADGQIAVGLRTVPGSTVLGALNGPENVVSFRTMRYNQYPTVVSGPGAGAAVTAAGMVGDLLRVGSLLR
jgi:homoserine dehydrogenase